MQLRATLAAYEKVAGHLMEEAIKSEFGGNIRHALLAIGKLNLTTQIKKC